MQKLLATRAGSDKPKGSKTLDACSLPIEEGTCEVKTLPVFRWFHNATNDNCEPFWFHGCGNNQNNFETRDQRGWVFVVREVKSENKKLSLFFEKCKEKKMLSLFFEKRKEKIKCFHSFREVKSEIKMLRDRDREVKIRENS